MLAKLGGPRSGLTEAEVDEVLLHAAGGRMRWGLVVVDSAGDDRAPIVLEEKTNEDWNAGIIPAVLQVTNGTVRGA